MIKVDGNQTGIYDGFACIVGRNKGKSICVVAMGEETDRFLSLNDCLAEIDYKETDGSVIVILEKGNSGKVYRYNNYSDKAWYEYGETEGYW